MYLQLARPLYEYSKLVEGKKERVKKFACFQPEVSDQMASALAWSAPPPPIMAERSRGQPIQASACYRGGDDEVFSDLEEGRRRSPRQEERGGGKLRCILRHEFTVPRCYRVATYCVYLFTLLVLNQPYT